MRRTRRDPRFLVPRPWEGMLRIPRDVVVEQHDAERKELWIVGSEPARRDERFTLELTPPGQSLAVRVIESMPVMMGGSVRHRLRLAILG